MVLQSSKLEPLPEGSQGLSEKDYPYRTVVGVALHLSRTVRPDIALAVSELSKYVSRYGPDHIRAANWLALYLKGTPDLGITYHGDCKPHLILGRAALTTGTIHGMVLASGR